MSGLTFAQGVNAAIAALISSNSGASAPSTDCTAVPIKGQVWLDTSVTPNVLKQYDGTAWVVIGALDSSNHLWAPPIGGGSATIASAGTTDLWSNTAAAITISGTTSISALANANAVPGTVKVVTAGGAFTLANGTAIELPSGANITTAAGDRFLVVAKTSTNVAVFAYTKADGSAVVNPSVPIGTTLYGEWGTIPSKTVYKVGQALSRSAYPDYFAAMTRVQIATLTAGNTTITGLANPSGLGIGMPIEGIGIQAGTTIASISGTSVTMSATATANGAQSVRFFITGYGAGGDSTTVGVTDCRGRTIAGRDDMNFNAASRLTASYFGAGSRIGAVGGVEGFAIAQNQLPNITPTFSGINDPVNVTSDGGVWGGLSAYSAGPSGVQALPAGLGGMNSSGNFTPRGSISSINGNVTQVGTSNVPPMSIAECVVVVLP
ncbi:hypothetical protein LPB73_07590 [Tardiphaga sp. 37S4]|uniref:hypothetical protein n=1 Tax=Tardiphaga sp. 37S4 TaxID=1404741 RepID=UPI001E4D4AE1|nr:hypothetical protein [Tardiphaga sp. 37S4]UFS77230.1 hypothetical protein LPB73_07590 [Tardiphaga sp. 37S4]